MSIPRETTIEVCLIGIRLPRHVDFVFPSGSLSKRAAARNEQRKEIDFYLKAKGWTGGARQTRRVDESGSKNISITIDCQPVTNTRIITHRRCHTLLSHAMYLGTTDGPSCIDIIAIAKAPN